MSRWPADSGDRMRSAALELFGRHGFAPVTVHEIASHAGVTERTFYRHFASKEEVLFSEGDAILKSIVVAITEVGKAASPRQVIDAVVAQLASQFETDRESHRVRAIVIASEPALLERDLLKQQQWVGAVAEMLAKRGLTHQRAVVLASAATSTFRVEYLAWASDRSRTSLAKRVSGALDSLAIDVM